MEYPLFPAPPHGGGYLVLTPSQFENEDLRKLIAEVYPNTKVYKQLRVGEGIAESEYFGEPEPIRDGR